jgi:Gpi18-like mannosyltransferase
MLNILALLLRLSLLRFKNYDLTHYVIPWVNFIRANGHFSALGESFSNYSPAYLYLMTFISFLPSTFDLISIKLVSIVFDWLAAVVIYRIVKLNKPNSKKSWIAYLFVLFLPTVFLDSSYWGQCDIIYTTFLLLSLLFLLRSKRFWGMVFFGIACAFKAHAVIFAPFLVLFVIEYRMPVLYFFIPAAVYLMSIIPVWILGRPLIDLLMIYLSQSQTYHSLSMNAPNPYIFFQSTNYQAGIYIGIFLTVVITGIYVWTGIKTHAINNPSRMIFAATFILVLLPFVLPKMHERYFFPGCLFAVILAFYIPRLRILPLGLQVASLITYVPFLRGYAIIPLEIAAIIMICIVVWFWIEYLADPLTPLPSVFERIKNRNRPNPD